MPAQRVWACVSLCVWVMDNPKAGGGHHHEDSAKTLLSARIGSEVVVVHGRPLG